MEFFWLKKQIKQNLCITHPGHAIVCEFIEWRNFMELSWKLHGTSSSFMQLYETSSGSMGLHAT